MANVNQLVERYQTARWKKWGVHVTVETIGDRPAGEIAPDHPLVKAASSDAGLTTPPDLRISSTDANIPLSRHSGRLRGHRRRRQRAPAGGNG
ncbi:MAG: hypothetical protein R2851_16290 [Caldilineaceae bacterium]